MNATIEKKLLKHGGVDLYYKNKSLFSDDYLDHLINGNSEDPYILENWETSELEEFSKLYDWMLDTWKKKSEILPTKDEAQLEDQWVRPILARLGWTYEVQDRLKKYGKTEIPDYSLFDSEETYIRASKITEDQPYFDQVLAVADAKAMGVPLDGTKLDKTNPSYQIIWYQQITGKRWGILTDGRFWRLYSTRSSERFTSYFEVNVEKFLTKRDDKLFKLFFSFFRKSAFQPDESTGQCFLDVVFDDGERYAVEIEDDLKARAFNIVEQLAQGFAGKTKRKLSESELDVVYQHSLYYLFRLLFVLNSEAKGLLNVCSVSSYYPYSLQQLCCKILEELREGKIWANQPSSYNYIKTLFNLIKDGDERIGVHGFGGEIFRSGNPSFYETQSVPDPVLNRLLIDLSCRKLKKDKGNEKIIEPKWKFIDYKRLSADHLGSIFEGLLEYHLINDSELGVKLHKHGESGERKLSGSYYTPSYVVNHVVRSTLEPLVKNKSPTEILKLKVLDPVMGSGHFLLGTVRFLEEAILEAASMNKNTDPELSSDEVRSAILKGCICGNDLNPLAVELAKFSLWMYVANSKSNLSEIQKQFTSIDFLVPKSEKYKLGFEENSFTRPDAIVSNFPWEALKFDELEFFSRYPEIRMKRKLSKDDKKKIFATLLKKREVKRDYLHEKSKIDLKVRLVSSSYYKYQKNISKADKVRHIDINLYKLSLERTLKLLKKGGRYGVLLPSGILGDLGCSGLRRQMIENSGIDSILGFSESADIFKVSQAFCIIVGTNCESTTAFYYKDNLTKSAFFKDKKSLTGKKAHSRELIELLDPDSYSIPSFSSIKEIELIKKLYKAATDMGRASLNIGRELHQTDDSSYLKEAGEVPVYKGEEIGHFRNLRTTSQYLSKAGVKRHKKKILKLGVKLAVRAIMNRQSDRRLIATVLPGSVVTVNSISVGKKIANTLAVYFYCGIINSKVLEFRFQQISKNNNINKYLLRQLPIIKFNDDSFEHRAIATASKNIISGKVTFIEGIEILEDLVAKLYGLDNYERLLIEARVPDAKEDESFSNVIAA